MRRFPLLVSLLLMSAPLVAGCDDDSSSDNLDNVADDFIDFLCSCSAGQGVSESECKSQAQAEGAGFDTACIDQAVAQDPSLQPTVDCGIEAIADLVSCLKNAGCDAALGGETGEACYDNLSTQLSACPQPSDAQNNAFAECIGDFGGGSSGDDYTCADGDTIPQDWVCDGDMDCTGGEDEASCMSGGRTPWTTLL